MNETIRNILARRSVRNYMSILPPEDEVSQILECGMFAATALGLQPWFFSIVKDRRLLDEISAENKRIILESGDERAASLTADEKYDNFRGAPMAIIVSGDRSARFAEADCANATMNMAVAATSLGIASCYIASFKPACSGAMAAYFRSKLKIPEGFEPYFALALGYTNTPIPPRKERVQDRTVTIE